MAAPFEIDDKTGKLVRSSNVKDKAVASVCLRETFVVCTNHQGHNRD